MKHYGRAQWADFSRGLVAPVERRAMRFHVESGCRHCARILRVQRAVVAVANADRRFAAPEDEVLATKSRSLCGPASRSWSRTSGEAPTVVALEPAK